MVRRGRVGEEMGEGRGEGKEREDLFGLDVRNVETELPHCFLCLMGW